MQGQNIDPATGFDGPPRAREKLGGDALGEWLYAPDETEPQAEQTEEQALEAQWAEEDLKFRMGMAQGIGIAAVVVGMPTLYIYATLWGIQIHGWTLFVWLFLDLPMFTAAVILWRRQELRIPGKPPIRGYKARVVAILLVASSIFTFVQTLMWR